MGFLDRIKNLIKYGKVAKSANNANDYPTVQVNYKGKTVEAFALFPYGLYANMDSSNTLGLVFEVDASSDNKAFIGHTPLKRPKDLNEGEVSLYHPGTGVFIKLTNNKIEINGGDGEVVVNTKTAKVNSETVVATISSSITFDCPATLFTGQVTVEGDLVSTASASFTSNITSNGKNIGDGHSHAGSPTAPAGPISPTGTVV